MQNSARLPKSLDGHACGFEGGRGCNVLTMEVVMTHNNFRDQWFLFLASLPTVQQDETQVVRLVGNSLLLFVILHHQAERLRLMVENVAMVGDKHDQVQVGPMENEVLALADKAIRLEEYLWGSIAQVCPACRGYNIGFRKSQGLVVVTYEGPIKSHDTVASLAPWLCPQS